MNNNFPLMYRVRQQFDTNAIADVPGAIRREFSRTNLGERVRPGQRVAVAVGSRGIHNLPVIVGTVVSCIHDLGLNPFILPAMGSHGSATAQGQVSLLNDLGISETSVGTPFVSSMDVVSLGRLESGAEVLFSKDAFESDHLFVINRVKPHTAFRGEVESGLCKMLAAGCGKQEGAINMHKYGLESSIVPAAEMIIKNAPVLCGLAIVENSLDKTHTVRMALPEEFVEVDRNLLVLARQLLPRIPIEDLDILIVDEMGKNISGAGIDPNVIGFWRRDGGNRIPNYRTLIVLDITKESHGNAVGIGMVDLTTRIVNEKVDLKATYMNALTTGIWASVRLPIALENDRAVIETALFKFADPNLVRMVRIVNTLKLETFWVTAPLLPELRAKPGVIVNDTPISLKFDNKGRLLPFAEDE